MISYAEPAVLPLLLTTKPVSPADRNDLPNLRISCNALVCAPTRPVCTWSSPPTLDYFWLGWDRRGQLRFSAIALYTGS